MTNNHTPAEQLRSQLQAALDTAFTPPSNSSLFEKIAFLILWFSVGAHITHIFFKEATISPLLWLLFVPHVCAAMIGIRLFSRNTTAVRKDTHTQFIALAQRCAQIAPELNDVLRTLVQQMDSPNANAKMDAWWEDINNSMEHFLSQHVNVDNSGAKKDKLLQQITPRSPVRLKL